MTMALGPGNDSIRLSIPGIPGLSTAAAQTDAVHDTLEPPPQPRLEKHRGSIGFPLIWDLTHNIHFANWKGAENEDRLPCLLRGHR